MCYSIYLVSTKINEKGWHDTLHEAVGSSMRNAMEEINEYIRENNLKEEDYFLDCEDTTDKYLLGELYD